MKLIRKGILMFILTSLVLTLLACGAKPDESVKNFFEAAKKSDFTTMVNYIKKDVNKSNFKYDDKDQEKVIKSVFSKVSYEIVSSSVDGKNATVKTKVTSLDLPKIYGKTVSDLMPSLLASAFSNANSDDAKNQVIQTFINDLNDPNASKTTTEVDIKLVKDNKSGWLIEPNDDLVNAITGNFNKAFANNNKSNDSSQKQDSSKSKVTAQFVVDKLKEKEGSYMTDITVVTAENDDNKLLGRPNQYTEKIFWKDNRSTGDRTDSTVEVFNNKEDADARRQYIEGVIKSMPTFTQYIEQKNNVLIRIDGQLTPDQANEYLNIFKSLDI
ncbi:hypothetical protein CPAST_c40020 [Clostridium pasteurianum DSM 525 = ATCC 6013]|uniref:Uncharacterized protein n=1 Tax=Clostridium pasteurianum DSM 525 = ATCC 6013 TaxID=1262449 RepID=A0A0H3J9K1_CLOPA|nr:DUF4878 domain-containing protein [Clostridium pasteurianum]AJA50032.1 hypothetical protein CPAST_c40020 [Clostridium pasteurianum DSM 525 = ATCC 6013]AJA54020.1 hypothetical protein CLPA_c40020 [Clostridium pasteurianum DSM 525 = ATCC 6013]AOZ77160.1 hypothetical protein AQ983_19455 [Clostridium pasteurianum DSM 525 = ATCC 6013]AOZ80957.1 hypothetical protein AQ984_19450 [Clostridium pasteurianum]ELP59261.1 hypothetical protein F502_10293 [Clostridium pasteurianum DSM 525 = ATCC 6013]